MNNKFIGISESINPPFKSTSLLLRRSFNIKNINGEFILKTIGLGIAVYYLNGQRITDGVLLTTNSDYSKTLYLDKFDVTHLIRKGKNVLAIELGNGFYNESLKTVWNIEKAHWRGPKCLFLKLYRNDKLILKSDSEFKVKYSPFTTYNELRAGECVDQRKYIDFPSLDYDDSSWDNAVYIDNPPKGKLVDNLCPPIKEFESLKPIKITKSKNGYIFDFGKNIPGYIEAKIKEDENREIIFKYAEDINESGELELHGLDCYQKEEPFQTDRCICDGKEFIFKPKFTYHGFRYVEVQNLSKLENVELTAIFTHQDIKYLASKPLSNELHQKIFEAGINSLLSNAYYGFTDCPTREKLNWLNDFMASLPVILKYFDCKELLMKIYQDVIDAQDVNGNVPGNAPSPHWGYEYGPLCGGAIIILPYMIYKRYGDRTLFDKNIVHIKKYYRFVKKNLSNGYFMLGDWTGSTNHPKTPVQFVLDSYMYRFDKILLEMTNEELYKNDLKRREKKLLRYKLEGQTIPSVLLNYGLGNKEKNLKALVKDIKTSNNHFDVGMFGIQHLFKALSDNGQDELVKKMICHDETPSFKVWIDNGATTLYETFDKSWSLSMNHHMFSCVIQYLK